MESSILAEDYSRKYIFCLGIYPVPHEVGPKGGGAIMGPELWGAQKPGKPRAHWQIQAHTALTLWRPEIANITLQFPNFGFSRTQKQDPESKMHPQDPPTS